jgi:hydrogenase maturation factor
MTSSPDPGCDHREGCITCGDEAVEMLVEAVDEERGLALCREVGAVRKSSVEIALVGSVAVDDRLLVHAGTAIARIGQGVAA